MFYVGGKPFVESTPRDALARQLAAADWRTFVDLAAVEALWTPRPETLTGLLMHPGQLRDFYDALRHVEDMLQIRLAQRARKFGDTHTKPRHTRWELGRLRHRICAVAAAAKAEQAQQMPPHGSEAHRRGWATQRLLRVHHGEHQLMLARAGYTPRQLAAYSGPVAVMAAVLAPDAYPLTGWQRQLLKLDDTAFGDHVAAHARSPLWSRDRSQLEHPQLAARWCAALRRRVAQVRDQLGVGPDHSTLQLHSGDILPPEPLPGRRMHDRLGTVRHLADLYRHERYARRGLRETVEQVRAAVDRQPGWQQATAALIDAHRDEFEQSVRGFDPAHTPAPGPARTSRTARILHRDAHRCGYCGGDADRVDHIVPLRQGGRATWENQVACCEGCLAHKAGRTPEQAGMQLKTAPGRPEWAPLACGV